MMQKKLAVDFFLGLSLSLFVTLALPTTAPAANGDGGGGNGGLISEGDAEDDDGPCECEKHSDAGTGDWTVTCINMAGSIGGVPLGMIGYLGSQIDTWAAHMDDAITAAWAEANGLDPDYYGSNFEDGFGEWDSLTVDCHGDWEKRWEILTGDCDENPPTCAPSVDRSSWRCEQCPFGYAWPTPMIPPAPFH
jgi:hypothetical protein